MDAKGQTSVIKVKREIIPHREEEQKKEQTRKPHKQTLFSCPTYPPVFHMSNF